MNTTTPTIPVPTNETTYEIFLASQEIWARKEVARESRLFQLDLLYRTLKDGSPTDSIMRSIAILDEKYAELWEQYLALVQAHADAVKALNGQPQ